MYKYSFEKLEVWKLSKDLSIIIYSITKTFPKDEIFGLSQMRRSAISIPSNISEGSSRTSKKDYARFIQIAYGSLMELLNQLIISCEFNYISSEEYSKLRSLIEEIGNKLTSLRRSIISQIPKSTIIQINKQ
jgi:four helix bundle protein